CLGALQESCADSCWSIWIAGHSASSWYGSTDGQGVFQLLWKHGNGGTTVPYRDCAVFMAWDQCKTRRHRCKPLEAKQRFRAAMAKMRLQILKAWGMHEPAKGFQIRRFPKADLDYLLRNGKKTRGARRSRHGSVYSDCMSETDCSDGTASEGPSTKPPRGDGTRES
ncbi:hypothetical protein MTO96_033075, partial [Rhipicephalus appendiculatus]